ncbi:MAG: hypothetical protein JWO06_3995 [Bacteroidota bacterium]|nr:hypothetical protein [Bacteroidota bacterium]
MRKVFLFLSFYVFAFLVGENVLTAQIPQALPYQAVARDAAGGIIPNRIITMRLSIRDNSSTGTIIYQETQTKITNQFGLFSLEIGQGNVVTGNFGNINWALNTKFLQIEYDVAGGNNYSDMGTTQMVSVPYALYALNAATATSGGTPQVNADWNANSGVAQILNKPLIPVFPPAGGTTLQYINGIGQLVTFPTNVSTFTNDAGYLTTATANGNYIQNGTGVQTGANFNVDGAGIIGTNLSVGNNVTVGGTQTVAGIATLNGGLNETGNVNIQGNVVINDLNPSPLAALDIASTTQGFLPPRMHTSNRNNITAGMNTAQMNAVQGLTIYNLDTGCIESFIGTNATQNLNWQPIGCGH